MNLPSEQIPCLNLGYVQLVDVMGNDEAIVDAARVSISGENVRPVTENEGLIRYLMRHRHCYTPEMEVLTAEGWKRWDHCEPRQTFLVPDPATNTLKAETLDVEVFSANEEIVCFNNQRMSFRVTADHRMYFKGKYQKHFEIVRANEMSRWGHFKGLHEMRLLNADFPHVPDEVTAGAFCDPEAEFVGFYLGDGSYASANRITFHLRKERKQQYLERLLGDLSLRYDVKGSATYPDAKVYWVEMPQFLHDALGITISARSFNKQFNLEWLASDASRVRGVLLGLIESDGHRRNDRPQIAFHSTSKPLREQFQLLCAMLGVDAHETGQGRVTAYYGERTSLEARAHHFSTEHYTGKVFCATTSTGLLMVRGGPDKFGFVCGNSTPFEMCLHGDTQIPTMPCPGATQKTYTIRELANAFERGGRENAWTKLVKIRTVNADGTITATKIKHAWHTGRRAVYRVREDSPLGREIIATDNHPFLTPLGYRTLANLRVGDEVVLNGTLIATADDFIELWNEGKTLDEIAGTTGVSKTTVFRRLKTHGVDTSRRAGFFRKEQGEYADPRAVARRLVAVGPCEVCSERDASDIHHKDKDPQNNTTSNLVRVCRPCHKALDGSSHQLKTYARRIASIELVGEADVYDLEVESNNHNFVANGFVVHNCEFKFRCKMPIFVARQWVRHRTACLAGDMPVSFDLPGAEARGRRQHYTLTMRELYERWQPTENTSRPDKQRNPLYKRERIQAMKLRSVNEDTGEVFHSSIVDVIASGEKDVYEAKFSDGSLLRATMDHRCLTTNGWLTLGEALDHGSTFLGVGKRPAPVRECPPLMPEELAEERWRTCPLNDAYEVSDLGRVRSLYSTRGKILSAPRVKRPTPNDSGHLVVSLSSVGTSHAHLVHHLVLATFADELSTDGPETRHLDGCPSNNRLSNLALGTSQENADDRMVQGGDQRLWARPIQLVSIEYLGREHTYDLTVAGAYHNFIAGGVVVHNSINEMSGRYSEMPHEWYVPDLEDIKPQASKNKQGRADEIMSGANEWQAEFDSEAAAAFGVYQKRLDAGMARELARANLPLSTYTQWIWKIDLHNLFHFLALRLHPHAQKEIRVFGEAMATLVKPFVPMAWQAFEDYRLNGCFLTACDVQALQALLVAPSLYLERGVDGEIAELRKYFPTKREYVEFLDKWEEILDPFKRKDHVVQGEAL